MRGEGVGMAGVEKEGSAGNRHPEEHLPLAPGRDEVPAQRLKGHKATRRTGSPAAKEFQGGWG